MGAKQSTKSFKAKKAFLREQEKNYTHLSSLNDKRYGPIDVYKNKNSNNWIMSVKRSSLSNSEYNQLIDELDLRTTLSHSNLLHIYDFFEDSQVNFCGDFKMIHIFSEYFPYDLEQELHERTRLMEYYGESELWYTLESLLNVGKFLASNGIYHGDIIPSNIHLTEEGFLKVSDHGLMNPLINGYYKTLSGSKESYLAPELLNCLATRDPSPKYDAEKADIFSMGMTILYMSSLVNPINCFDYYGGRFDFERLDSLFFECSKRYSPKLCETLKIMTAIDARERPTYQEILALVNGQSGHKSNANLQLQGYNSYLQNQNFLNSGFAKSQGFAESFAGNNRTQNDLLAWPEMPRNRGIENSIVGGNFGGDQIISQNANLQQSQGVGGGMRNPLGLSIGGLGLANQYGSSFNGNMNAYQQMPLQQMWLQQMPIPPRNQSIPKHLTFGSIAPTLPMPMNQQGQGYPQPFNGPFGNQNFGNLAQTQNLNYNNLRSPGDLDRRIEETLHKTAQTVSNNRIL